MAQYQTLQVTKGQGVCTIRLDNGELNLADGRLIAELSEVIDSCEADDAVAVIVLESGNPEFFMAHLDLNHLTQLPETLSGDDLFDFTDMVFRLRTSSKISIAKIEGRARGGGMELALACDMRFGALGSCIMGMPEVGGGIIPGGGGTAHLPGVAGPARAMEVIIGGGDFSAELAERYGIINRALPRDEISAFVDRLARRIARFPRASVVAAKRALVPDHAAQRAALVAERRNFMSLLTPEVRAAQLGLLAIGAQTVAVETLCFDDFYDRVN